MSEQPLNLFYQEPMLDRWVPYDRYPRKLIRKFGITRAGKLYMRVFEDSIGGTGVA